MTVKASKAVGSGYRLQGKLLEVCSCPMPCACWVGEDPPGGWCYALNVYHFESGDVGDVDIAGLNVVRVIAVPGNVRTEASWREVLLIDDRASAEQHDALVGAFKGDLGGPLADIARLVADLAGVESVPIEYGVRDGSGTVEVDGVVRAVVKAAKGRKRKHVSSNDEAQLAKPEEHRVALSQFGMEWAYGGGSAVERNFRAEHTG